MRVRVSNTSIAGGMTMPRYKQMPLEPSQLMLYGRSVEDAVPMGCDVRACPPYPPEAMVKVLGYAYSKGIRSSRKIEQHLNYDVRFIWLAGGLSPDHNTIARFRKENCESPAEMTCLQTGAFCWTTNGMY